MRCLFFYLFIGIHGGSLVAQEALNRLDIHPINEQLLLHTSYLQGRNWTSGCNGLVFVDQGKALVLDTPVNDSSAMRLLRALDSLRLEVVGVVPSHWHVDCLGGLTAFHKQGIPSYALEATCGLAEQHGATVPMHAFRDSLILHVGNQAIHLYFLGGGHTPDNMVAWIPSQQCLFAGCMLKGLEYSSPGNMADADREAWPHTLQKLVNRFGQAQIVVPGHGTVGGVELLSHMQKLLEEK